MGKKSNLKEAKYYWELSNDITKSEEDRYWAECMLFDLIVEYDYVNEYIKILDEQNGIKQD